MILKQIAKILIFLLIKSQIIVMQPRHRKCGILFVEQNLIKYSSLKSSNEKQLVNIQQTKTSKRQSIPHQDR